MSETKVIVNENTEKKPIYFDANTMPWQTIMDKHLNKEFKDLKMIQYEDTGLTINFSIYPKGFYKEKHVHACGHGIFVLKGTLLTDEGEFGPGAFIWYPEGTVASHGATGHEDCVFLYIQEKKGKLTYVE